MVKFVAKKGVNIKNLEGIAELVDNPSPSDFSFSSDKITFQQNGIKIDFFGTFAFAIPPTGTLEKAVMKKNGNEFYRFTNLNVDISDLLTANTAKQVAKTVLKGNDTIIGSNQKDKLFGFDGNDTIKGRNRADTLKGGDDSDKLNGGRGKDTLKGGADNDILNGGKGSDILNGGGGLDKYDFKNAPGAGVDTISKFQPGEQIRLDNADFANIGSNGTLLPRFFADDRPPDHNDHVIYNQTKGFLFHDPDGAGGQSKVLFAKVTPGTDLENTDFIVI